MYVRLSLLLVVVCAVSCRHIESTRQKKTNDDFVIPVSLNLKNHSEAASNESLNEFQDVTLAHAVRLPAIYEFYSVNDDRIVDPGGIASDKTLLDDWSRE